MIFHRELEYQNYPILVVKHKTDRPRMTWFSREAFKQAETSMVPCEPPQSAIRTLISD